MHGAGEGSGESGSTHPIYNAYYTHFNDAYNSGETCTKSNHPCW
jgi:hypothetical protein